MTSDQDLDRDNLEAIALYWPRLEGAYRKVRKTGAPPAGAFARVLCDAGILSLDETARQAKATIQELR